MGKHRFHLRAVSELTTWGAQQGRLFAGFLGRALLTTTWTDNSGYGERLAAAVCSLPLIRNTEDALQPCSLPLISNTGVFQHALLQPSNPTPPAQSSFPHCRAAR